MSQRIGDQLARLGSLRFQPADLSGHVEALEDVAPLDLEAAVGYALRSRSVFPTPAELRADADLVCARRMTAEAPDRTVDLAEPVVLGELPNGSEVRIMREWRYFCDACDDSGWISWWCGLHPPHPLLVRAGCGRRRQHLPHEWAAHCQCYESNPELLRKRALVKKYAADQAKRSAA